MMEERGVYVDHTTLYRWVQKYSPELEKRIRWHARTFCKSWHLDETYLRVKGKWKYLYRAIDKNGGTIDFMISSKRNYQAAYNFLKKRSEEHTSELQSLMRISYAVFCLKKQTPFTLYLECTLSHQQDTHIFRTTFYVLPS